MCRRSIGFGGAGIVQDHAEDGDEFYVRPEGDVLWFGHYVIIDLAGVVLAGATACFMSLHCSCRFAMRRRGQIIVNAG